MTHDETKEFWMPRSCEKKVCMYIRLTIIERAAKCFLCKHLSLKQSLFTYLKINYSNEKPVYVVFIKNRTIYGGA